MVLFELFPVVCQCSNWSFNRAASTDEGERRDRDRLIRNAYDEKFSIDGKPLKSSVDSLCVGYSRENDFCPAEIFECITDILTLTSYIVSCNVQNGCFMLFV